jgi:hypothetical protein
MIGLITGMIGGDIADAATARYALQRFETQHKRKATPRDLAIVVGMIPWDEIKARAQQLEPDTFIP